MQAEPVIDREEVVGMLFALAEVNAKLARIISLLEREFDGEEEAEEDDA